MKIRTLLVLLLILALILPLLSSFYFTQFNGDTFQTQGGVNSVLLITKEAYIYARVQVTISPQPGSTVPVILTFENGTTLAVVGSHTYTFILPNSVTFSLVRAGTGGPGFSLSTATPIAGAVLNANDTYGYTGYSGMTGIDAFYIQITGFASVNVDAMGVSV
jgi:hypothetical protein